MGWFIRLAIKMCLIIGIVVGSAIAEKSKDAVNVIDHDPSQSIDEANLKPEELNDESLKDSIPFIIVPNQDDSSRSFIAAPPRDPRDCPPCYRRDNRGVCHKIMNCH